MKKTIPTRILMAAALALPLLAAAQEGRPPMGPHPMGPHPMGQHPMGERPMHGGPDGAGARGLPFLRGLELTEAQQDQLFQLMHSQEPYMREQHKAHEKAMRALRELGMGDKFDDSAAARLAQAAAQAQANLALAHARNHQKVLALLTAAQRKQLEEGAQHPHRPPHGHGPAAAVAPR